MDALSVALVGFMGAGKSVVGRRVAERLGHTFVDSDLLIEARAGKSIAAIFAEDGEERFRALEREAFQLLTRERGLVIATGGGAFADEGTRRLLLDASLVVYLRASFETIWERVGSADDRPLIRAGRERARELFERRLPIYQEAHVSVDADRPVDEVVEEVLQAYHASLGSK